MNWLKKLFRIRRYAPIKLTIKAVIRWEQLNEKPFSLLDYNDEDEIVSLFYVCTSNEVIKSSLDEFTKNLKPADAKRMVKEFQRQTAVTSQFQITPKKQSTKPQKDKKDSSTTYIKDIIATLVMDGLDVHFALDKMELCDLPIFLQAYDKKIKDKITAQRLWAYKLLSPHLAKGTTPEDIHPLPWDSEEEIMPEVDLEEGKSEFKTFLSAGLKK